MTFYKDSNGPASLDSGERWMLEKSMRAGLVSSDTYQVFNNVLGLYTHVKMLWTAWVK